MTTEVKFILSEKFKAAVEKESLTKTKASELLMLGNHNYGCMVCKLGQFDRVPKKAWIALQRWANSGETIQNYSRKRGFDLEFFEPEKKKVGRPKNNPPKESNMIRDFIAAYNNLEEQEQKDFHYIMNKLIRL